MRRNAVLRICETCGGEFYRVPSVIAKGHGRFCSVSCAGTVFRLPRKDPTERFWSKVDKSGDCWEWTACRDTRGYGAMSAMNGERCAPRVSWTIHYGPIPDGLGVLHKCDNPGCVNPDHLFLGTHLDNMNDRSAKGRVSHSPDQYGEGHPRAILNNVKVIQIRRSAELGIAVSELSKEYGVRPRTIRAIVNGTTWKHLLIQKVEYA